MSGYSRFTVLSAPAALLALALIVLAAACGGGDATGDKSEGETPTGDTPAAETPADDGAEETPTSVDADGGEDGDGDDAESELQALAGEWADRPAKVTYEFSTESAGQSDSGTMALVWDPPDWRMDIAGSGQGESTLIFSGGTSFFCSEPTCISIEGPDSPLVPPFPFLGSFVEPDALSGDIAGFIAGVDLDVTQETIAGESADCFSVSSDVAGIEGSLEWCFSSDGILLRSVSSAEGEFGSGSFSLEATEVSRDVSESDFEPPYEVTDLGDLGNLDTGE